MAEYLKPIPVPDGDTLPFWQAAKRGELAIQRCLNCRQYRFYPRLLCPNCLSPEAEWVTTSGRGEVYSFCINRRPAGPAFADDVPYVIAIVELSEGVRLMTNIVGCPPEDVRIGMPVTVELEDITDEIALPKFKPA